MPEDSKQRVISRLNELREALSQEPISDLVTRARHQCDRLEQGLLLAHKEGIRFAAHTLLKLLDPAATPRSDAITTAHRALKAALEQAGLPH
jgi:hypothetical protein